MNDLSFPQLAMLGALFATLGAAWRQISQGLAYVAQVLICQTVVKDEAALAVTSLVLRRGRRSPFGVRLYGGSSLYVHPPRRTELVGYETFSSSKVLMWVGKFPVFFGAFSGNNFHIGNTQNGYTSVAMIYLRWTIDPDKFIETAIDEYNILTKSPQVAGIPTPRFRVTRIAGRVPVEPISRAGRSGDEGKPATDVPSSAPTDIARMLQVQSARLVRWSPEDLVEVATNNDPMTGLAFPKAVLDQFNEIEAWLAHEQWFRSKGIPWRRGWLLYGPPGTGKTSLVKVVGRKFDLPIFSLELASMDNRDLVEAFDRVKASAPAIALIEDIDNVFQGRENVVSKNRNIEGVTFDCLLNAISGVIPGDGVLLMLTTNRIDTIDDALGVPTADGRSSRPGRIDRVIHLGPMELTERWQLANFILGDTAPDRVETVVADGEGDTAAQFQDRCAKIAQELFWKNAHKKSVTTPA